MAGANYRLCDKCGCKTFYDNELDYSDTTYPEPGTLFNDKPSYVTLPGLGAWAVICTECAKTHRAIVVPNEAVRIAGANPDLYAALEMVRDADEDCKRDGLPTIPAPARRRIDAALAKARGEQ